MALVDAQSEVLRDVLHVTLDYRSRLVANRTMGVVEARCRRSFVVASKVGLDGKGYPVSDLQLVD